MLFSRRAAAAWRGNRLRHTLTWGDDIAQRRAEDPSQPPFYSTGFYPLERGLGNVVPGRIIRIRATRNPRSFGRDNHGSLIRQF